MPVPRGMRFMAPKVEPPAFVDIQPFHQPAFRHLRQPDVIGFDQSAASDIDEAMAEDVHLEEQFSIALLERPQIHLGRAQADCLRIDIDNVAHGNEIARAAQPDHQA